MATITQRVVDTVDTTGYGPVTLCEFTWQETGLRRPEWNVVSSAQLTKLLRRRKVNHIVTAISELENVTVLTDEGVNVIGERGAGPLFRSEHDGLVGADANQIRELLDGADSDEVTSRCIVVDFSTHSVYALDSVEPLHLPIEFNIDRTHVDLDKAHPYLQQHPWVRSIETVESHYHSISLRSASSLRVGVMFDETTWSELVAYADSRYSWGSKNRKDRKTTGPTEMSVREYCTWYLRPGDDQTDPLGLAPYAQDRDTVDEDD